MTTATMGHFGRVTDRELELSAIISTYNDVTERLKGAHERLLQEVLRLREELGRKNAELHRRERLAALGEMAAGLAHEIRNPLGGINLYASMLERELANHPKAGQAASRISGGVRSLERLVSEILDFAQDHKLDRRRCAMDDILAALEDGTRFWAEQTGGRVVVEPSAGDCEVYCDRGRMTQVLLNLVINGLQAAGRGGTVWVRAAGRADGGVEICVSDDGPGIAEENLQRVFNPFYTTKTGGTGLGLSIVQRLIEAHGGTVRADHRPEGGARFVILLPLPEEAAAGAQDDDRHERWRDG